MNDLQIFHYEGSEVRTVMIDGKPWWVLKDVCDILEIGNSGNVAARLDEDEKGIHTVDTLGGKQELTVISESGLYSTMLLSRKPEAKKFKRWITHEVIPAIRKHGGYIPVGEDDDDSQIMARALLIAQKTINQKNQLLEQKEKLIQEQTPKAVFADAVTASKTTILVGELAKILKQKGVNIGQNRLFEWMRQNEYLIRRKGTDYNMPTQKSMELGLFEIKESAVANADGSIRVTRTPKITGRGQVFFVNKFLSPQKSILLAETTA
jgi:anti-repressor protein